MCKWGTEEIVRVLIPVDLSHTGQAMWKDVGIDACIADLVRALQSAGINMRASCCGHERGDGRIDLTDGRVLIVRQCGVSDADVERDNEIARWNDEVRDSSSFADTPEKG